MARRDAEQSAAVASEGARVQARRKRLDWSQQQLADASGVSRQTLIAVEQGKGFQQVTLAKLQRALDEAEKARGIDEPVTLPSEDLVEFEVRAPGIDATVVVRGPIEDRAELEESVLRLLRGLSQRDEP